MTFEFPTSPLSALADLTGGYAFKSKDYSSHGRFILRTLNIDQGGSISRDDAVYLPHELCRQYTRFELKSYDTLFVMVGATLGKIGLVRENDLPALLNQNMWRIRAKREVADPRFLHYAFRLAVRSVVDWASGSAREFVRRDDFRKLQIPAPALSEQRAIAHVLGTLDDKIELNRRMNQTLEEIARTLFKSWFVAFDPVRAKAEGRQPEEMDAETAALFPDGFAESELGVIPRGWTVSKLGNLATNPRRIVDPNSIPADTPYIGLEHMPRRSIALDEWGTASQVDSGKHEFLHGEILFGKLRPYFHKVGAPVSSGICSTDILVVKPTEPKLFSLVLALTSSDGFVSYADAGSHGTRMPRADWRRLSEYAVCYPSWSLVARYDELVRPLVERIWANIRESRTLVSLRDALLPRLLSGELRIPDVATDNLAWTGTDVMEPALAGQFDRDYAFDVPTAPQE